MDRWKIERWKIQRWNIEIWKIEIRENHFGRALGVFIKVWTKQLEKTGSEDLSSLR